MGDPFFGFKGVNNLVLRRSDIVPVENAMAIRLSPLTGVKDLLEQAKDVAWQPKILGLTKVESEVFAIIKDPCLLEDSWLAEKLTNQQISYEQLELISDLLDALDQVPTVKLIDFLSLLISNYINHPVAEDIVSKALDRYTEYTGNFFFRLIAPINNCLNSLLDICLLQSPTPCFQYYYFQASALSESWAAVMRPYMLLAELKELGNYRASSVLYNLWAYFINNCQKIMREEACINLWTGLHDVLPIGQSNELNLVYLGTLDQLRKSSLLQQLCTGRPYSVLDDQGIEFSFGNTSFFCNDITTYWVELTYLTFEGNSIQLKFADCRPFEFVVANKDAGSQEVRNLMSHCAFLGLYKRWCGSLHHNLPIQFGDISIRNAGIECDGTIHHWDEIELKVKEDKFYMYFFEYEYGIKIRVEFACFDLIESPNAFMLKPIQEAVKLCQADPSTTFLEAWCSIDPENAIDFDLPDDDSNGAAIISAYS